MYAKKRRRTAPPVFAILEKPGGVVKMPPPPPGRRLKSYEPEVTKRAFGEPGRPAPPATPGGDAPGCQTGKSMEYC